MAQEENSQDSRRVYEARVDIKKFSQFLQGQFNPTKVICSECRQEWTLGVGLFYCL